MALVSAILTSIRYDIRDKSNTEYDDPELTDFLNRALRQLYKALGALGSDWVEDEDTSKTLSNGDNYVAAPTDLSTLNRLWTSDKQKALIRTPYFIRERRQYIDSGTGEPRYCAMSGTNIIFDYTADVDYTLAIEYNKKQTTDLVAGSAMPFDSQFNDQIIKAVALFCKIRNDLTVAADAVLYQYFLEECTASVINRGEDEPPSYRLNY